MNFEKATPESLGISSANILKLLDKIDGNRLCMHGFILMRHGKTAAEGYWKPFHKDRKHRMFSASKSFASAAIGALFDEGKISLDDKVCDYFKDKLPPDPHPYVTSMKIKDLLMMSTPYTGTTYYLGDPDWVGSFFNTEPSHPPGTIFNYDTSATLVLCALVERVTGMGFLDYLHGRVLKHTGFSPDARCILSPDGVQWGGSGVLCTTRDLARLALVFLNKGMYDGKQLISEEYVKLASGRRICNLAKDQPDGCFKGYGYGYQIWRLPGNAFAFWGMGSQFAVCYPEKDLLFACNGDTQGNNDAAAQIILNSLRYDIVENLSDAELPGDKEAHDKLSEKCKTLEILPQDGEPHSSTEKDVNGKTFKMYENPMEMDEVQFDFSGGEGAMSCKTPRGIKKIGFGLGRCKPGHFDENRYFGDKIGVPSGRKYECLNSAAWTEKDKLFIRVNVIDDHIGNLNITASFKNGGLGILMIKSAEWFLDEYEGFAGSI